MKPCTQKQFSKRVNQYMDENNYTPKSLAKKLKVHVRTVNRWRNGHDLPELDNFAKLSNALCVAMDDLYWVRSSS